MNSPGLQALFHKESILIEYFFGFFCASSYAGTVVQNYVKCATNCLSLSLSLILNCSQFVTLIPRHPKSSHVIPRHPTSSHFIPLHPTSSHLIPRHPTSSHLIPPHPTSSHLITPHPTSSHLIPPHRPSP